MRASRQTGTSKTPRRRKQVADSRRKQDADDGRNRDAKRAQPRRQTGSTKTPNERGFGGYNQRDAGRGAHSKEEAFVAQPPHFSSKEKALPASPPLAPPSGLLTPSLSASSGEAAALSATDPPTSAMALGQHRVAFVADTYTCVNAFAEQTHSGGALRW